MRFTADDVLDIAVPEHLRGYELENGELIAVSLPTPAHGRIAAKLAFRLHAHIERAGTGGQVYAEVGYVLPLRSDPERLRGPDASFVAEDRLRAAAGEPDRGWFRLVPDLVIEIDSPGRRPAIEQQRIQNYVDAGGRMVWVIHAAARSATVYRRDGSAHVGREDGSLDGEDVLPGFELPLADLYAG